MQQLRESKQLCIQTVSFPDSSFSASGEAVTFRSSSKTKEVKRLVEINASYKL